MSTIKFSEHHDNQPCQLYIAISAKDGKSVRDALRRVVNDWKYDHSKPCQQNACYSDQSEVQVITPKWNGDVFW